MQIYDCAAVVTGGASGMGAAVAKLLAEAGAKVALFDLNIEKATHVAEGIGGKAYSCDVTQETSVAEALKQAAAAYGAARLIVNCAGIIYSRRLLNREGPMPLREFRRVIEVNLIGTFNVMRLASEAMSSLPLMGEERGVIINTASIAAFDGQVGQCAYSASKGGIVGMTLPAARDLAPSAIRVVGIAPGIVNTPMAAGIPEKAKAALLQETAFPKRFVQPEEFAQLVIHIIQNPMLNGEVIRLDGGLRMPQKMG